MNILFFGNHLSTKVCMEYVINHGDSVLCAYSEQKKTAVRPIVSDHIQYYYYPSINDPVFHKCIRDFAPEYIIACVFGEKIPQSIISLATIAAFNIHPAPLPQVRSGNAWFWVIRNQLKRSAIAVHYLTEKWDSGDIVLTASFDLSPLETQGTYADKVVQNMRPLMEHLYPLLLTGSFNPIPQKEGQYYPKIAMSDCCIDWCESCGAIEAHIRACNPFHFAFTSFRKSEVKILEADVVQDSDGFPEKPEPGALFIQDNQLYAAAIDGWLQIKVVFVLNKGFYSGERFVRYFKVTPDDRFFGFNQEIMKRLKAMLM